MTFPYAVQMDDDDDDKDDDEDDTGATYFNENNYTDTFV